MPRTEKDAGDKCLSIGDQKVMGKRFPEDDLGLCLASVAFTAFVTRVLGMGGAGPNIGEKQNAHRGHHGHDEQSEVDTAFHNRLLASPGRNYILICYTGSTQGQKIAIPAKRSEINYLPLAS